MIPGELQSEREYREAIAEDQKRVRVDRLCVIAAGVCALIAPEATVMLGDGNEDSVVRNVARLSRAILAKLEEE